MKSEAPSGHPGGVFVCRDLLPGLGHEQKPDPFRNPMVSLITSLSPQSAYVGSVTAEQIANIRRFIPVIHLIHRGQTLGSGDVTV